MKKSNQPVTKGVAKVPVIMQLEASDYTLRFQVTAAFCVLYFSNII
ncbi:MAG: hypothetical protein J6T99_05165 [Oscillospiraceae bacterium]|nr:hypothetical protein [Oscillospiraceae bacterium]